MLTDEPLGPATSLVLLGTGLLVALSVAGAAVAHRPRRGRRPSDQVAEGLARSGLRRFLRRRFDPAELTGLALTVALLLIFLAALAFGQVADMVTSRTGLYRVDAAAADWGARHASPVSTHLLGALTWLGSTVVIVALALASGMYDWYRRRRWTVLGFMLMVVWGQNLIANGVKLLVERPRPPVPHLAGSSGWSFPSGHSASAAATYAALALLLGRGRPWPVKAWLGTAAAGVTMAVAASRVLLGVHWVTDVAAGVALGLGWFAVCSVAFGGSVLRFGAIVEQAELAASRQDWRRGGPAV
ncbi:MAG TPA: phosphatase PAP2 family protein [Actinomycetes bacterium]|nr:phosphatase PAP2 family protein [Actinomycetes bacterium]